MNPRQTIRMVLVLLPLFAAQFSYAQDTPGATQGAENSISYLIKAQGEFLNGNLDSAKVHIEKSLALDAKNDAAWFLKSKIDFNKGDFKGMTLGAQKAYELDSDNIEYAITYARNLVSGGKIPQGIEVLEKAHALSPKNEEVVTTLAQVYAGTGNFSKAEELATEYKSKVGETHMAYYLLYNIYSAQQKNDEALKLLLEADEKAPAPLWTELIAEEYLKNANDSLAEVYYDKALAENPNSPAALFGKMEIERTSGNIGNYFSHLDAYLANPDIANDKKLNYLQEVLKSPYFFDNHTSEFADCLNTFSNQFPKDTAVGYLAGQFDMVANKKKEAAEILQRLLSYYPADKGVATNYISYLYTVEDWAALKEFTQKHLQDGDIKDLTVTMLQTKSTAEYFLKDYSSALKTYTELEKIANTEGNNEMLVEVYSAKGDLLHNLGKKNECYKYYKKALEIDPEYCPVLNNYAWYLATDPKTKDLEKAQQMSKITIQKEAGNSTYLDTYAYILFKRGYLEEAKKYYQQAIAFGKDLSSTIYHHYASCLYALGEYDLAKKQYLNALNAALNELNSEEIVALQKEMEERKAELKIDLEK